MDVSGVGAGPAAAVFAPSLPGLAGIKHHGLEVLGLALSDGAGAGILHQLSELEFVRLIEFIERPAPPERAPRLEGLLRASVSAASEGNLQRALARLTEFVALDPLRAETLETEPGLASIKPEVSQLLSRLLPVARLDAESRLAEATNLVRAADSSELLRHEISPETIVQVAGRFLEAGGYANCMRSAELSRMTIDLLGCAPVPLPLSLDGLKTAEVRSLRVQLGFPNSWMPRLKQAIGALWLRAPLLILLLVWFAVGLLAGTTSMLLRTHLPRLWPESRLAGGFEVWSTGFLVLILFGFDANVRKRRR